jgi:hypothetical protein
MLVLFLAGAPFTVEFCEQRGSSARARSVDAPQRRAKRARASAAAAGGRVASKQKRVCIFFWRTSSSAERCEQSGALKRRWTG